jgi:hypothetical protein
VSARRRAGPAGDSQGEVEEEAARQKEDHGLRAAIRKRPASLPKKTVPRATGSIAWRRIIPLPLLQGEETAP